MLPAVVRATEEQKGCPPDSKAPPRDSRAEQEFKTLVTSLSSYDDTQFLDLASSLQILKLLLNFAWFRIHYQSILNDNVTSPGHGAGFSFLAPWWLNSVWAETLQSSLSQMATFKAALMLSASSATIYRAPSGLTTITRKSHKKHAFIIYTKTLKSSESY